MLCMDSNRDEWCDLSFGWPPSRAMVEEGGELGGRGRGGVHAEKLLLKIHQKCF